LVDVLHTEQLRHQWADIGGAGATLTEQGHDRRVGQTRLAHQGGATVAQVSGTDLGAFGVDALDGGNRRLRATLGQLIDDLEVGVTIETVEEGGGQGNDRQDGGYGTGGHTQTQGDLVTVDDFGTGDVAVGADDRATDPATDTLSDLAG